MTDADASTLREIILLSELESENLRKLEKECSWKTYHTGEDVIDRQSDTRNIFFVVRGKVRVANYSLSGQMITLDDLGEGSHFGELSAIDGEPRSASVIALEESMIASLSCSRFLEILKNYPGIAINVMKQLTRIVRTSTTRIMDLSTLGANNRVHAEVLRRARASKVAGAELAIKPIPPHSDIASRVSTTRETVSRVMADLARQGIVERTRDSLIIHDLDRLEAMVEEVRGE